MKFHNPTAEVFVPDGVPEEEALARTTYLAVGAHQDDIEIMAVDGILKAWRNPEHWFCGVVVTNGSGSPRAGIYARYSDAEMMAVRRQEQKKAAVIGKYGAQVLLDYPSAAVKDVLHESLLEDLAAVLLAARPQVVYTHNPADRHPTHVAVALRVVEAIRRLSSSTRPAKLYGCEVWLNLDWLVDRDKIVFDVSQQVNLQTALLEVFASQVAGGKRYDLATMGRRRANATYYESHDVDSATGMTFAMDLTPLVEDPALDVTAFVLEYIQHFADEVAGRIARFVRQDNSKIMEV